MDDISSKISALLNDPESMQTVMSMANSLLGGNDGGASAAPAPKAESPLPASDVLSNQSVGGLANILSSVSPDQIGMIMKVMTALNSGENDSRSNLLMALRPHLSEERRERVDRAIKLLRLASLLPLIGDSGLLKLF